MALDLSRLGLRAVIVRTWRIRLARYAMKAGSLLAALAERLLPGDLRH